MIFSQYRDSVQEIGNMLNSLRPMVKPIVFVGQSSTGTTGKGWKQKEQVQVVQRFRDGAFNVLVSTCVGEEGLDIGKEGLDIGEVALIICFDASSSPTRLIQRMGRAEKTIFLLTRGNEEEKYQLESQLSERSFSQHCSISNSIKDPKKLEPYLYKFSPRMVPVGVEPTCYKMSVILSSKQNSVPLVVYLYEDDDDVEEEFQDRSNGNGKNENEKSALTKWTHETSKTTEKSGINKKRIHTVTKMFEEVEDEVLQTEVMQPATVPDPVISDLPNMDYEELSYDYQDDSHNTLPDIPRAYQRDSMFVVLEKHTNPVRLEDLVGFPLDSQWMGLNEDEIASNENCSPVTTFGNQNSGFTSESRIFTKRYSEISEMPASPPSQFDVIRASSNQTVPMEEDQTESMPAPALQCHSNVFQMPEPLTKGLKIEDTVRKSPSTVSQKNPAKQNKVFAFKASAKPTTSGMIQGISPIRSLPSDASPGIFKSPHAMAARPSRFSPFNKSILSSASSSSVSTSTSRSQLSFIDKSPPRNRRTRNPVIESEAEFSLDDLEQSLYDGDMNDFYGLDDFDDSLDMSDNEEIRCWEWVQEVYGNGVVENPLFPLANSVNSDGFGESGYKDDSICLKDSDYIDVGVLTQQAMNATVPNPSPQPTKEWPTTSVEQTVSQSSIGVVKKFKFSQKGFEDDTQLSQSCTTTWSNQTTESAPPGGSQTFTIPPQPEVGPTSVKSQQGRYLESVKDAAPVGLGQIEKPLSPRTNRVNDDGSGESYYEKDSICQEEVEYMDVEVFTQGMNAAKVDLALNGPSQGRQTRRAKREALNSAEDAKQSKQRRRIVMMVDSSDED